MSDALTRARERLTVSRLGKPAWRETDRDLIALRDLIEEHEQVVADYADCWQHHVACLAARIQHTIKETQ